MALNLKKDKEPVHYYYLKGGNEFGPLDMATLLNCIDGETMVRKDGSEITQARKFEELEKYFPISASYTNSDIRTQVQNNERIDSVTTDSPFAPLVRTNTEVHLALQVILKSPFSFNGRIGKYDYRISVIFFLVSYIILWSLYTATTSIFISILFIPLFWFLLAKGAQRCHDCGKSGWFQIIPFCIFYLLLANGDNQPNIYGNNS